VTPDSLELIGLSKNYGSFHALDSVSFRFEGSRVIGYLGPNGAGKTTTLKILTGLVHPTSGRGLINGIDVTEEPRKALACVGSLVETPEPYGTFTVKETIEMAGEFRGMSRPAVGERIAYFDRVIELPPLDRRMAHLSKGLRQRVVLAASLVSDPPVILLDEPTSGLDPAERVRVRNLILELKRSHLVFMSSHLLGEVTETCEDVVFLYHGKVIRKDSVAGLSAQDGVHKLDATFLESVDPARFAGLTPAIVTVERIDGRRFRFTYDGTEAARASILDALRRVGPLIEFSPAGSTLESTYLDLMERQSWTE
jgi:ABC-2 type transport system ATP-binding protein